MPAPKPDRSTPQQMQFVAELVRNGGNASAAARSVGYHPDHGRRLVSRNATVKAAVDSLHEQAEAELREWAELAPRAQARLEELLEADDSRVALMAAREILDRAVGKPVAKMQHTVREEAPRLSEGQMQLVLSMMMELGWAFATCVEYVKQHPEEAQQWIAEKVTTP